MILRRKCQSTKKKCVFPFTDLVVAQRVGGGVALLFHDRGTRRDEWSAARPGRTLHPGKTRYPPYRRLGGPQGRSGRADNLAPPGFDPRTVQPEDSRYTDWASWPTVHRMTTALMCNYTTLTYLRDSDDDQTYLLTYLLNYLLTYLLTPWSRILLEKLISKLCS